MWLESLDVLKEKGTKRIDPASGEFTASPSVKMILDLTASPPAGGFVKGDELPGPRICISYSELDFGGLKLDEEDPKNDADLKQITDSIREKVKDVCEDIPLKSLTKSPELKYLATFIGSDYPDVVNAAASGYGLEENVEHVAIRLEVRGGSKLDVSSWKRFYSRDITSDLGSTPEELAKTDWSVLLPVIKEMIRDELSSSSTIELKSGLDPEWHSSWYEYTDDGELYMSEGRAIATVKFNGEAHQSGCNIEVQDITFFAELYLKETNLLRVHGVISWNLVDSDVLFCASFDVKTFETFLLGGFTGPLGMLLFNPLGFAIVFFAVIYMASTFPLPVKEKPKCTHSDDGKSWDCEYPIAPIDRKQFGRLDTTVVRGVSRGLLLGGTITPAHDTSFAPFYVSDVLPFKWDYEDLCTKDLTRSMGGIYIL